MSRPRPRRFASAPLLLALAGVLAAGAARGVERCEVNGQSVNPSNGYTTQDKTGLMRCREEGTGPVTREQELQQGKFMGIVRRYRDGVLERDYRVNERGNRDGLSREYAPAASGGAKAALIAEDTYRDGRNVGVSRRWYPDGRLRRVGFHGDDERESAHVEMNADGQLAELRCAGRPVLAPHFDDARACGFAGDSVVTQHTARGAPKARTTWRRGEAVRSETLWDNGAIRELQERGRDGGSAKSFAADGTLRRETEWVDTGERLRRVTTLEREFQESGRKVRERRFRVVERGAELVADEGWYLNGQPREKIAYASVDGRSERVETRFHDNGQKAFEGSWLVGTGGRSSRDERATGVHRNFDASGRVRVERSHDERGRVNRERAFDESGALLRDDELFEDGSRKAFGR